MGNPTNPFRAAFYSNGARQHLGYYNNATDAALAYNKKAKSVYGTKVLAKKAGKWNDL